MNVTEKGFSLVELLIVVLILGTLATIAISRIISNKTGIAIFYNLKGQENEFASKTIFLTGCYCICGYGYLPALDSKN
jgi:prepilin-type N-terminal cleavage/methylation domain-containing protein